MQTYLFAYFYILHTFEYKIASAYSTTYTATMHAPVGKFTKNENNNPNKKHVTDIITEHITIFLKLLVIFLAIIAGNTIKLDIKSVPIILIPRTTTTAVINDIRNW